MRHCPLTTFLEYVTLTAHRWWKKLSLIRPTHCALAVARHPGMVHDSLERGRPSRHSHHVTVFQAAFSGEGETPRLQISARFTKSSIAA